MKDRIIDVLNDKYEAIDIMQINDLLGLKTADELSELQIALDSLVNDYQIYLTKKNKYILLKNCKSLKIGTLSVNKKGFGFVILPKEEDIYISNENLNGAVNEDVVLCEIIGKGIKNEGRIVRILKRNLDNMVGEIIEKHNKLYLKLDDDKKNIEISLTKDSLKDCVPGHKVLVKVIKKVNNHHYIGEVVKIIGHKDDPGADILSIAYKYNINNEFNEQVIKEVENIPNEVRDIDLVGRRDLTNKCIFTIDGSDTKDIDDAISLELTSDGLYRLGVHIADVSYYVKENTALGEAFLRGTSNYLADTVIPMLPHKLSNGICSLNENVIRLTISCVMDINEKGKVVRNEIFPSFIKSKKKMTYDKVNDILMRNIVDSEYINFNE